MKVIAFLLVAICLIGFKSAISQASIKSHVKKITGNQYEIIITVVVEEPWHIYSTTTPDEGPFPTEIKFSKNPLITLVGKLREEGVLVEKHEEVFDTKVKYYEKKVVFTQKVNLKSKAKTNITGTIEYMLCNDEQCMPPKKESFNAQFQ